jgi:phospholipid/cholesterol/gamma-HCH transport system substrate-binding protein
MSGPTTSGAFVPRRLVRGFALAAVAVLLTGCGFRGAYSISLPGGADVGDDPYTVEVEFLDALDLVQQSGVRVADVPVGRVESIELGENWTAVVTIIVNGDVELPANAVAAIQQSSLLGEKFVELAPPGGDVAPRGELKDGDRIPLERTNRNVEVEELLGAMSLVLNGGGLAQLQTINRELGNALEGRESAIKSTLRQLDTFIGGLDQQKEEISRALDSANRLAETLAARTATIETALDTIGPGLDVLNDQRDLLVSMLDSLARLGDVGTRIIEQSAENTVADLQLLQPILTQLAAAGPNLARALELLLTYPFPDSSLSALNYREAQTGGYALFTNMTATLNLDLTELLCRYGIDQAGALVNIDPTTLDPTSECGQSAGGDGAAAQRVAQENSGGGGDPLGPITSLVPAEGRDVTGRLPGSQDQGLPGFPELGRAVQ